MIPVRARMLLIVPSQDRVLHRVSAKFHRWDRGRTRSSRSMLHVKIARAFRGLYCECVS